MDTRGKTVVITGGGSGIGLSMARAFVAAGSTVVICGRNAERLERAKAATPALETQQCDVSDTGQVMALVERCNRDFGGADVVVNNAGVFNVFDVAAGELGIDEQLVEIDVDFGGPVRVVNAFLPHLLQRPEAAIVNVSSALAFVPFTAAPVYSATKAAVHSWTRSLRHQLKGTNVAVIELMPPLVDTEMVADVDLPKISPEKLVDDFMAGFAKGTPEIKPGQSSQLRALSRLAPAFIFKQLNKPAKT